MLRLLTRLYGGQPKDPRLISVAISLPKAKSTVEVLDLVGPLLQERDQVGFCLRAVARSLKSATSGPSVDTDPRYLALKRTIVAEMDQISLQSICDVTFWLRVVAETSPGKAAELSGSDQQRFLQRVKHFSLQGSFRNRQLAALIYDFSILNWSHRELENLLAERLRSQLEVFTIVELKLVLMSFNHWGLRVKLSLFDLLAQRITRLSLSFADPVTMVEMHSAAESLSQRYSWPAVALVKHRIREAIVTKFPALSLPAIFHAFLAYIVNPVVSSSLELPLYKALPALVSQADFSFLQQLMLYLAKVHVVNRERFPVHIAKLGIETLATQLAGSSSKQVEQLAVNISQYKQWISPQLCAQLSKSIEGRPTTGLGRVAMVALTTALGQKPPFQAEIAAEIRHMDLYLSLLTYSRLTKCPLDDSWSPILALLKHNIESFLREAQVSRLISLLLGLEHKGRLDISTDLPIAVQFILNALKTELHSPLNTAKMLSFLLRVAPHYPEAVHSVLQSRIASISLEEFHTFLRTLERTDRSQSLLEMFRLRKDLAVPCVFVLFRLVNVKTLKAEEIREICGWMNERSDNNIGDAGLYSNFHSAMWLMRTNPALTERFYATLMREMLGRTRVPAFAVKIFHYLSTISPVAPHTKQTFLARAVQNRRETDLIYFALQGESLSQQEQASLLSIGFTESGCDLRDRYCAVLAQKDATLHEKLKANLEKFLQELPIDSAIECVESLRAESHQAESREVLQLLLDTVLLSFRRYSPSASNAVVLLGLLTDFRPAASTEIAKLIGGLQENSWYLTAAEKASVTAALTRLALPPNPAFS